MDNCTDGRREGLATLYQEHLLLGAKFEGDKIVRRYANEVGASHVSDGAILSDVSDMDLLLFDGAAAEPFANAAFAGRKLGVGECAFEASLTGDGSLASVPLLARTGAGEYIVADLSARSEVLVAWLSFLSAIEQDGRAPFAGLGTEDVSGSHVALVLAGARAAEVLADYVAGRQSGLPGRGRIARCMLDNIPCIVAHLDLVNHPAYLVLVPPVHAVALWRSLLSFAEVAPVGRDGLLRLAGEALPWLARLRGGDAVRMPYGELRAAQIVRESLDFVGARGLGAAPDERS